MNNPNDDLLKDFGNYRHLINVSQLGSWPGILAGGIYTIGMSEFDRNPDAHGWHLGKNGNITITFQASMFADKNINSFKFAHILNDPNNTITGTKQGYEINRVDVIQHEFGHGFAYYLFGDDYNSWNNNYKENWAYWYVNETYRIPNGMDTWAFQGRNFFNWFPFLYKGRNPVSNDLK